MKKIVGRVKGILMLIMLMLIATRLTWLQTTENTVDISSTFYRTGLWVNDRTARFCRVPPEATFPLPAAMAVRSDMVPPPPSLGHLAPGLALTMLARCSATRLEAEDFIHWNPWLFMGTALTASTTVRLLTSSWTSGLLAAVAVLSRGTLQSRAALAAAEPFSMFFVATCWCFAVLCLRTQAIGWGVAALLAWTAAILYTPTLWVTLLALPVLILFAVRKAPNHPPNVPLFAIQSQDPPQGSILGRKDLFILLAVALVLILFLFAALMRFFPESLQTLNTLHLALSPNAARIKDLWPTVKEIYQMHAQDVDLHSLAALLLLCLHPFMGGRLKHIGRSASLCFIALSSAQMICSFWLEAAAIHTSTNALSSVVPSARALEPLFIAWSIASLWRILDAITGYRLSASGWSIRGRANMR